MKEIPIHNGLEIICELIDGVQSAIPKGGTELDVRTIITRPLWQAFMMALGHDPDDEPTGWLGVYQTRRVYGSETIVVDSTHLAAVSFPKPCPAA